MAELFCDETYEQKILSCACYLLRGGVCIYIRAREIHFRVQAMPCLLTTPQNT